MRNILQYFFKLFLFLLLVFFIHRILFLLFQLNELKEIPAKEILFYLGHSFVMDVSASCYILLFPFALLVVPLFRRGSGWNITKILPGYIYLVIVLSSFINVCDIALYEAWGTRINQRAISFLLYPEGTAALAWSGHYIFIIIAFFLQCALCIGLYKRYFKDSITVNSTLWKKISFIVLTPGLLLIGIRGGLQKYPLDTASVYFSRHSFINQAALNSSWNFVNSLRNTAELENNPYHFFSEDAAKHFFNEAHATDSLAPLQILKTTRPNILLIMLESFSAEVIEPLGGEKGITPGITELVKEGLLFTNFYSPGFRTEQGLAALVSGFPSQPSTTVIRQFGKFDHLPSLANALDAVGYESSYYYGGDLHFAQTGSYLKAMGFDKIKGDEDYSYQKKTGWGGYDEELFAFFNSDMKQTKQPFFSIIMTSTNHEPFNADVKKIKESISGNWCGDYINTVHYTDKCLTEFIELIKKQSWYSNTLIAVVADHGHSCPNKAEYNSAKRHHIPFFLFGDVLKEELRGKTIESISSQIDFPATILTMLNLNHDQFKWSKNVLNTGVPHFAFYSFDDGFGWINDRQQLVYDGRQKKLIFQKNDSLPDDENEKYFNHGKAYLQLLMDEYLRLGKR